MIWGFALLWGFDTFSMLSPTFEWVALQWRKPHKNMEKRKKEAAVFWQTTFELLHLNYRLHRKYRLYKTCMSIFNDNNFLYICFNKCVETWIHLLILPKDFDSCKRPFNWKLNIWHYYDTFVLSAIEWTINIYSTELKMSLIL